MAHETAHPGRALRRRWCQHQGGLEQSLRDAGVGHAQRGGQVYAGFAVHRVQRLHRPVHHDGPDAAVHAVQDALGLAEGIAQQHRRPALCGVGAPPGVDVGHEFRLRGPAVDGQAEGRFGNEGVAAHRLELRAGAVGVGLVVARRHPHTAAVLHAHLCGPEHMAGRVQRNAHAMVFDDLAIRQRLQGDVGPQPGAQHAFAVGVCQVVGMAHAGVVRMPMRDHRAVHGLPGVDEEVAGRAVQAFGPGDDQVLRGGSGHVVSALPATGGSHGAGHAAEHPAVHAAVRNQAVQAVAGSCSDAMAAYARGPRGAGAARGGRL